VFEEMLTVIDEAKLIIDKPVDKPFEFVKKKYKYSYYGGYYGNYGYSDGWYDDDYYDGWGWKYNSGKTTTPKTENKVAYVDEEDDTPIYGIYFRYYDEYEIAYMKAYTEDEAVLDFLKYYDDVPYKDILGVYDEDTLEKYGLR
jgi:hypothetical protein